MTRKEDKILMFNGAVRPDVKEDFGTPSPIKTNLTGDLERAFNYGWKAAIDYMKDMSRE